LDALKEHPKKNRGSPHLIFQFDKLSNRRLRKMGERLVFLLIFHNRVPHQIYLVRGKKGQ
jgi:hypothetical protein